MEELRRMTFAPGHTRQSDRMLLLSASCNVLLQSSHGMAKGDAWHIQEALDRKQVDVFVFPFWLMMPLLTTWNNFFFYFFKWYVNVGKTSQNPYTIVPMCSVNNIQYIYHFFPHMSHGVNLPVIYLIDWSMKQVKMLITVVTLLNVLFSRTNSPLTTIFIMIYPKENQQIPTF